MKLNIDNDMFDYSTSSILAPKPENYDAEFFEYSVPVEIDPRSDFLNTLNYDDPITQCLIACTASNADQNEDVPSKKEAKKFMKAYYRKINKQRKKKRK